MRYGAFVFCIFHQRKYSRMIFPGGGVNPVGDMIVTRVTKQAEGQGAAVSLSPFFVPSWRGGVPDGGAPGRRRRNCGVWHGLCSICISDGGSLRRGPMKKECGPDREP